MNPFKYKLHEIREYLDIKAIIDLKPEARQEG